jgi:hypothetical protein
LAFQVGKTIQFDNSAIRFGITIWQNELDLIIRQFGLANRFAKWAKIVAPVFWHKDLDREQLRFQEVARQGLFAVAFYTKWYLTTKGRESWAG